MATVATAPGRPLAVEALRALAGSGASWCVLRGAGEDAARSAEIDLLAAAADLPRIEEALAPLGFARVPAWGRGSHRFLVAFDPASGGWLKLDVVTELAYGPLDELRTDAAARCLERAARDGGTQALAPEDEFFALLLHCLLDKRAVPPRHRERLAALAGGISARGPLALAAGDACPPGWDAERLLACARDGSFEELTAVARLVARRWARRDPLGVARRRAWNGALRKLAKVSTALGRRGLRVALLGPDGAGKSTLSAELERSFFFPVRRLYAGLYPAGRKRHGVPGLRFASLLVRLRRASLVARWHQLRGRLVVFDRYPLDARLRPARLLGRRSRLRRRLIAAACPRPDLVVVLDAPAEVLRGRKAEHPLAELERQRRAYLELAAGLPGALVVDTTGGADKVRGEVIALIWRAYGARRR